MRGCSVRTAREHRLSKWPVFTSVQNDTRVHGPCTEHPCPRAVLANILSCNAFCEHGPWTLVLGSHYPCSRAVFTGRIHG